MFESSCSLEEAMNGLRTYSDLPGYQTMPAGVLARRQGGCRRKPVCCETHAPQ